MSAKPVTVWTSALRGAIMFKNSTERAFVLVMLMCGFVALWIVVQDVAFGG
jgi:hypothetical protein|tara:strand:- start:390 stop:542 length:153 start_codon:yes stop_codon:yes gene_type:complete